MRKEECYRKELKTEQNLENKREKVTSVNLSHVGNREIGKESIPCVKSYLRRSRIENTWREKLFHSNTERPVRL